MSKSFKILNFILIFLLIALMNSCVASKQNPYAKKKKQNSHVSASQLGRNKLFYSPGYQKKLSKSKKR